MRCQLESEIQRAEQRIRLRRADELIARKSEQLQRKSESLDRRQAAMDQLQADVTRMHRESLELRLATEELWVRLSGKAPPAPRRSRDFALADCSRRPAEISGNFTLGNLPSQVASMRLMRSALQPI